MFSSYDLDYWGSLFVEHGWRQQLQITFFNFMHLSDAEKRKRINYYLQTKKRTAK